MSTYDDEENEGIGKYVRRFDYFGVNIPFRINGKRSYQSILNGSVFLIFMLVALAYAIKNFYTYATFKDFKFIFSKTKYSDPVPCNLKKSSIGIAIAITMNGLITNKLDPYIIMSGEGVNSYRNSSINTDKSTPTRNYTCKEFLCKQRFKLNLTKKCTPTDFYIRPDWLNESHPQFYELKDKYSTLNSTDFKLEDLANWNCPDFPDLELRGLYQSDIFNYFSIDISLNNSLTVQQIEELKTLTIENEFRMDFKFTDSNLDVYNRISPGNSFVNSDFLNLDYIMTKKKNLYYELTDLTDDYNPVWQDSSKTFSLLTMGPKEEYFFARGDKRYDIIKKKVSDPTTLAKIFFRASQSYTQITRIYYKLSEMMADTLSLAQLVLLVFYFFCTSINEMLSFRMIMRKSMKFRSEIETDEDFKYFKEIFAKDTAKHRKYKSKNFNLT